MDPDTSLPYGVQIPPDAEGSLRPVPPGPGTVPLDHDFLNINNTLPDGMVAVLKSSNYVKDEFGITHGNHPLFTDKQKARLRQLIIDYKDVFAFSLEELTGYTGTYKEFTVELQHDRCIVQKQRRHAPKEVELMDKNYSELLKLGFIELVDSSSGFKYAVNSVVVPKKDAEGRWTSARICNDYRPINDATSLDRYQMHNPDELWLKIGKSRFFSKIDLRSGFLQLPVAEESRSKTAFWWKGRLYQYTRAPFGLKNLPAHFQQVIDHETMQAGVDGHTNTYIDDMLMYTEEADEHLDLLEQVFKMLRRTGLKAHPDKSIFGSHVVEFLGHNVSAYGMTPAEAKTVAISNMPMPKDVSDLKSLLGFVGYYRCYVMRFAHVSSVLNDLMRKGVVGFPFGSEHEEAVNCLKRELLKPGNVIRPADLTKFFLIHTDWSNRGIGAVLGQLDDEDKEYMVACVSRSLNVHERQYSSYQGELLAVVWAIKTFCHYLLGRKFRVVTDHLPLRWLLGSVELSGQAARWAMQLQGYEMEIEHRPGKTHQNADVLSRFPLKSTEDHTGARLDENQPAVAMYLALMPHQQSDALLSTYTVDLLQTEQQHYSCCFSGLVSEDYSLGPELSACSAVYGEPESDQSIASSLRRRAHPWVMNSDIHSVRLIPFKPQIAKWNSLINGLPSEVTSVDNTAVGPTFFPAAELSGIVLVELFGGMSTGLEAFLKNGFKIASYFYCDKDPLARAVSLHRALNLAGRYPDLLSLEVVVEAYGNFPKDVMQLTAKSLQPIIEVGCPIVLMAGWPCQDFSSAGKQKGLSGSRSSLIWPLVKILAFLQKKSRSPFAYLLENTAMQHNYKSAEVRAAFQVLVNLLGPCVTLDAVRFGSHAHRLRNFWTNLARAEHLQCIIDSIVRPESINVQQVLDPRVTTRIAKTRESAPYYPCNTPGQPQIVLPTLMSFNQSYNFRKEGNGVLIDKTTEHTVYREPNAVERERMMGFAEGSTAAHINGKALSNADRCSVIGAAIDMFSLQYLLSISYVLTRKLSPQNYAFLLSTDQGGTGKSHGKHQNFYEELTDAAFMESELSVAHVYGLAAIADTTAPENRNRDVWTDAAVLGYIQGQTQAEIFPDMDAESSNKEMYRVKKRAKNYKWEGEKLFRILPNTMLREVPKPGDRLSLITVAHERTGHFGVRRTVYLLLLTFWWSGIFNQVSVVITACPQCDQARIPSVPNSATLYSLPIMGMMYRWGVDVAGPFTASARGNTYVLVCIEHFTKWIEVVPMTNKSSDSTAYAFTHRVLARYGAPAEVVTDQGTEFQGEFARVLLENLIDHRSTSGYRPQSNGLAERAVKTVKGALQKSVDDSEDKLEWDLTCAWIALGYNCSTQQSTRHSPYELIYAHPPVIPPAVRERMEPALQLGQGLCDDDVAELCKRAELLKERQIIAGQNLSIAQQRDTLRYAKIKGGGHSPRIRRFLPGDLAYVKDQTAGHSLNRKVLPIILRIVRVYENGTLVLQGKCGTKISLHSDRCAPCHLTNVDLSIDQSDVYIGPHKSCEICRSEKKASVMILCDYCNDGYHTFCLDPPLRSVPQDDWYCPYCEALGLRQTTEHESPAASYLPEEMHLRKVQVRIGRPPQLKMGRARYLEGVTSSHCLEIEFDDQTRSRVTPRAVQRVLPLTRTLRDATVEVLLFINATQWPDEFLLDSEENVKAMFNLSMPGTYNQSFISKLVKDQPASPSFGGKDGKPETAGLVPLEILSLLGVIDVSKLAYVLDCWAYNKVISDAVKATGIECITNCPSEITSADLHEPCWQPKFFRKLETSQKLDAIITCVPLKCLDLFIPIACQFVKSVLAVYVPAEYLSQGPEPRQKFLKEFQLDGRLCLFVGMPKGPTTSRGVWVCFFASRQHRHVLVKGGIYRDNTFALG